MNDSNDEKPLPAEYKLSHGQAQDLASRMMDLLFAANLPADDMFDILTTIVMTSLGHKAPTSQAADDWLCNWHERLLDEWYEENGGRSFWGTLHPEQFAQEEQARQARHDDDKAILAMLRTGRPEFIPIGELDDDVVMHSFADDDNPVIIPIEVDGISSTLKIPHDAYKVMSPDDIERAKARIIEICRGQQAKVTRH